MSEGAPRTRYCSRCLTTFVSDGDRCSNLGCRSARPQAGWGELAEAGELIDRTYRIHSRLAIGGAGVTYLAREIGATEEIGPLLAVKVLYQQRDQGPYLRRLAIEAQILQGLNHPQIVECRGFVQRAGHSPYLVTKFEAGGSLLDHIRRVGLLPPRAAAAVAMQVCDALAVSHRQGVIHRDLKPENVLLEAIVERNDVPRIRVADFGIAKVFGGVGERLTRVGAFIGTPQYAAPEQFDGMAPEPATDVYAVGALLYFCLTARPVADFMAEIAPEDQRDHLVRHLPPRLPGMEEPEARWIEESFVVSMTPDPGDRCPIDRLAERLHSIALGKDPGRPHAQPPMQRTLTLPPDAVAPMASGTISNDQRGRAAAWAPNSSASTSGSGARPAAAPRGATPRSAPGTAGQLAVADGRVSMGGAPVSRTDPPPSNTANVGGPVPTIDRGPVDHTARNTSVGCLALAVLLGGVALAIGGGWWFWSEEPHDLTGREVDPQAHEDWQTIAYTLGERGAAAEKKCGSPPFLAMQIVVEPDGRVRSLELLNYAHEPTRQCIEAALQTTKFPRKQQGLVRVAVQTQR